MFSKRGNTPSETLTLNGSGESHEFESEPRFDEVRAQRLSRLTEIANIDKIFVKGISEADNLLHIQEVVNRLDCPGSAKVVLDNQTSVDMGFRVFPHSGFSGYVRRNIEGQPRLEQTLAKLRAAGYPVEQNRWGNWIIPRGERRKTEVNLFEADGVFSADIEYTGSDDEFVHMLYIISGSNSLEGEFRKQILDQTKAGLLTSTKRELIERVRCAKFLMEDPTRTACDRELKSAFQEITYMTDPKERKHMLDLLVLSAGNLAYILARKRLLPGIDGLSLKQVSVALHRFEDIYPSRYASVDELKEMWNRRALYTPGGWGVVYFALAEPGIEPYLGKSAIQEGKVMIHYNEAFAARGMYYPEDVDNPSGSGTQKTLRRPLALPEAKLLYLMRRLVGGGIGITECVEGRVPNLVEEDPVALDNVIEVVVGRDDLEAQKNVAQMFPPAQIHVQNQPHVIGE